MNRQEIDQKVIKAIQEIAPEIVRAEIDVNEDIRDACDLDSMDFINYLIAIKQSTGVDILEKDYKKVMTYQLMVDYLAAALKA